MLEVGFDTGDDGVVRIASGRRERLFDDSEFRELDHGRYGQQWRCAAAGQARQGQHGGVSIRGATAAGLS